MPRKPLAALLLLGLTLPTNAWGPRAHSAIDRAAVESLPADGPVFLKNYVDWIDASSTVPDSWRGDNTPFLRIEEDPNHGWFREQFAFMPTSAIPRSRYEFVLALYDHYLSIRATDPATAARTNVRWTGTLPYAAMEAYGRLVSAMRGIRAAQAAHQNTAFLEQDCAFYTFELGHYIGDGAMPLHDSVQHDGWVGPNPHGYTTSPTIHGRFESTYVDKINLTAADIAKRLKPIALTDADFTADIFTNLLAYLDKSGSHVEDVYALDKRNAYDDPNDPQARELVYERTTDAARFLRDLLQRAWLESALPTPRTPSSIDLKNPSYNPATGSAPATPSIPLHQ